MDAFFTNAAPYYAAGGRGHKKISSKAQSFFAAYEEKNDKGKTGVIGIDGLIKLCKDLEIDPGDPALLVFSWRCEAEQTCRFTKEEFFKGIQRIGVETVQGLAKALPALRKDLDDDQVLKGVYNFTYDWAKTRGQKSLVMAEAVGLWQLLLSGRCVFLDEWCKFVTEKHGERAMPKDVWDMLLPFINEIKPDMSDYDPYGCWPTMIDEFVDYYKELKGL